MPQMVVPKCCTVQPVLNDLHFGYQNGLHGDDLTMSGQYHSWPAEMGNATSSKGSSLFKQPVIQTMLA